MLNLGVNLWNEYWYKDANEGKLSKLAILQRTLKKTTQKIQSALIKDSSQHTLKEKLK